MRRGSVLETPFGPGRMGFLLDYDLLQYSPTDLDLRFEQQGVERQGTRRSGRVAECGCPRSAP